MNRRFNKDWFWEETFDSAADLPALLAALDAAMAHRRRGTRPAHLTPLNDTDLYHLGDDDLYLRRDREKADRHGDCSEWPSGQRYMRCHGDGREEERRNVHGDGGFSG